MAFTKSKIDPEDFITPGLYEKTQAAYDEAWNKLNPKGTLIQNYQKPVFTFGDFDDFGGVGAWAEADRAIRRGYGDQKRSENEVIEEELAAGRLDNKGASSNYSALAADALSKADNYGAFKYDFNNDPMFKMLANSYMQQAQRAAGDASAMAAARTGGYGNSYGAAAASQQYNQALSGLYDQVPELEQAAYSRWLQGKQELYDQAERYGALGDKYYSRGVYDDETAYARGRDALDDKRYDTEWQHGLDREARADAIEDYNNALQNALVAAEYGDTSKLAELLGADVRDPQEQEKLSILASLYASGDESALAMIYRLLGLDYNGNITYGGSGGQSGGSGGRSGGSSGSSGSGSGGGSGTAAGSGTGTNGSAGTMPAIYNITQSAMDDLMRLYGKG